MSNQNLKIYILGASGYLGSLCTSYFRSAGYQVIDNRVDVTNLALLTKFLEFERPDVAINLSGPPANPTIDWCEDHKEETASMIVTAPTNFVIASVENNVYPIHLTSGCIYSGETDYEFTEEDEPNFFGSEYSRQRIKGQESLFGLPVLQARIRMPMSASFHPRNFITKITSYNRVISIPNSVTVLEDLWPALEQLIRVRPIGVLNLTNEGHVEHSQLLEAYKKFVDPSHNYELISLEQLQGPSGITRAKRSNCVLSTKKAKGLGVLMPQLTDAKIEEIMVQYKKSLKSKP